MKSLKRVTGIFHGTGAACYLCFGAIPQYVKLINLEIAAGGNPILLEWYAEMMGQVAAYGGIIMAADGTYTKKTTTGLRPYEGGELLTTVNQTDTSYLASAAVYLGWDLKDYRADKAYGTAGAAINKWTNDGTTTGHFNASGVASVCRIGVGSIIRIKQDVDGIVKEAAITALTSTPTFTTSGYVTLSRTISSGAITFIGGMYTLAPIALGKVTPAGIYCADVTVNADGETVMFDAQWEV